MSVYSRVRAKVIYVVLNKTTGDRTLLQPTAMNMI